MVSKTILANGRFLTRPLTGVDRVAIELLTAFVRGDDELRVELLHPKAATLYTDWLEALPPNTQNRFELREVGRLQGHLWEQIELGWVSPERILLNLCSTGPVWRRNQAVMIHDAQVWDVPQSYSRSFRSLYKFLLPLVARRSRLVLTVSAFSRRRLETLGVVPHGKVKVIPNGADHILRQKADPKTLEKYGLKAKGYLMAIGSLAPHKNLRLLIEAARKRRVGEPELIIVGGMNTKVFSDMGLSIPSGVRLIGRVSDGELRALYDGAIALTFPSLTEGFGLPALEAALCGCPVIATTGGAVPEVCGDGVLYVSPNDQEGWTAAMERLSSDIDLRSRLAQVGGARANEFTWQRAGKALADSLQENSTINPER